MQPSTTRPPPRSVLPAIVLAQLGGTSSWFAVNAVMPDLQAAFGWPAASVGLLTAAQRRVTGGVAGPIAAHLTWSLGMLFLLGPVLALGG